MSMLVLGLSHRTAPLSVLEKVVVAESEQPKLLNFLVSTGVVTEALIVSTCNRLEVWAMVDAFHAGLARIAQAVAHHGDVGEREFTEHCYVHYGKAAVQHMFSVTASLDSMVVGEQQILGQVRSAYATATEAGTVGAGLHGIVQHALRTGKLAQSQTAISHAGPSMVSRALDHATHALVAAGNDPSWAGISVGIIGSGAIGSLVVADLKKRGSRIHEILTFSRTRESAERLAAAAREGNLPARAESMADMPTLLTTLDVVITCAGAVGALLTVEDCEERTRPLVVCDLSVPRDVEPAVTDIPEITVIDVQSMSLDANSYLDTVALAAVENLVAQEVHEYFQGQLRQSVVPTVTALRQRAEEVVAEELLRLETRLPGMEQSQRAEVSKSVRRVVDKLLHIPTTRVKEFAGDGEGVKYAEALQALFDLTPGTVSTVTELTPRSAASTLEGPRGQIR